MAETIQHDPAAIRAGMESSYVSRRSWLAAIGGVGMAGSTFASESLAVEPTPRKSYRVGVVSAALRGQSQKNNGHTWHFCFAIHPRINLDAIKKYLDPGSASFFANYIAKPASFFHQFPFPDTTIACYYDSDREARNAFCEAYEGVKPVDSIQEMMQEGVDAVWLGDASGIGDDHFDLIAPALEKGLPVFCDKPIGGTVAGTRKILEYATKHNAPIMSSSLFRHMWGTEQAIRLRDSGEHGPIQFVLASLMAGYNPEGWLVYGQHPVWSIVAVLGAGIQSVSAYARENSLHALIAYPDKMPAEVWYGRPDAQYSRHMVAFTKKTYEYSSDIEDDWWYGHCYSMFRMQAVFREMIKTRVEPIPHREILEVTAVLHAAVKSLQERGRLVDLAEVM